MPFARHMAAAFAVMLAATAPLAAQGAPALAPSSDLPASVAAAVTTDQSLMDDTAAQQPSFAPTAANAQVGMHSLASSAPVPMPRRQEPVQRSVALMIVGGAVLVVGAVIGGTAGTVVMIGGGTIGIIGLLRYLQY